MTRYYFLRSLGLILLGLLIYGRTFQFGFVFDDHFFVENNPFIKNFNDVHLMWHPFPMTRLVGIYSFALNYFLNQLHPWGYHIFNFIVHIVTVGLVWALTLLLFKITKWLPSEDRITKELPFFIAVLFLVHPCQTQAVSYISQRFESMATVFYLGTVYCYLYARLSTNKTRKIGLFGLACLLTILGIFTKEVIITVPAMILASEWILFPPCHSRACPQASMGESGNPKKYNNRLYIILVVLGVLLYVLFTKLVHADLSIFMRSIPSDSHAGDLLTPARYFLTQMRVFLTFLRLLVLPIHQNLDYDYPASTGLLHPPLTLMGLCVLGAIIFLIIKLRRHVPLIAFGLAWMLITFSINLAPRANVIFEHKLYLISFGFFLTFVTTLSILVRNRRTLVWMLCCVITVSTLVSFQRNKIWGNELALWDNVVRNSPHKARPYNNRGYFLDLQGHYAQAIADFNKAIALDPNYADAYNNRGRAYFRQGNFTQATADFTKAIELSPNHAELYNNRGLSYTKQGNYSQAILDYSKAIEINPQLAGVYSNLRNARFKQDNLTIGVSEKDYFNLGTASFKQGNFADAISDFTGAIKINPKFVQAYNDRGLAYYNEGNYYPAIIDYNKAIDLDPDYADAYYNRGLAYDRQANQLQALSDFNKAIKINPDNGQTYSNRAIIYYRLKEYDKAWEDVYKAEKSGAVVNPQLLNALKAASGRDK